jgi:divalent metal cation (Fe/Co/Zn/Cd) transporter
MRDWRRIALGLVAGTMAYNVAEAVVALWAGVDADSIALLGFGLDSVIECAAAGVMLGHLLVTARGADAAAVEASEHRAHRFIGATFLALAAWVAFEAVRTLGRAEPPRASAVGIVLAALSTILMPFAAAWKLRAAREIGSAALRSEAKETLACAWLSVALLLGLAANAWKGWWWADPAVALLMVPWLVREGIEGLRGEGCCVTPPGGGGPAPPRGAGGPGAPAA